MAEQSSQNLWLLLALLKAFMSKVLTMDIYRLIFIELTILVAYSCLKSKSDQIGAWSDGFSIPRIS